MSKNVIFCFSGSGNCLDIAKNIAKELKDTDIVMMRGEPAVKDVTDARRVGFVFPCYGGGLPGDVEKYVKMLKISPNAYTFGVCSYAGYLGALQDRQHRASGLLDGHIPSVLVHMAVPALPHAAAGDAVHGAGARGKACEEGRRGDTLRPPQ